MRKKLKTKKEEKNMLISITGKLGSGKSTICNILKERYGFEIVSTGTINREFARSLGITTLELNERLKSDPALDNEIDGTVTRLSIEKKDEKLIFDSRMAWHFVPSSFAVYMQVDIKTSAERIMNAGRQDEKYSDIESAVKELKKRRESEILRYNSLYGVDIMDMSNYDLVVDTNGKTPMEVADIIIKNFEIWLKR